MRSRLGVCAVVTALVAGLLLATSGPAAADPVAPGGGTVVDAASAPDEGTASKIAEAFGHPVTADEDTTETEQVDALPDGSMQLTESSVPVRVQQNGAWVPVDTALGSAPDGSLVPLATAVPVQFSGGGTSVLAEIRAQSGQWLSESWQAGTLPTPTVAGNTATYAEVYPGVDLDVTATASGMSEVLVVKTAAAAANPALANVGFGIDDGSLTTTVQPGGAALSSTSDGTAELVSAAATWWDSSSPGASAAGPGDLGLPVPIAHTSSPTELRVDASGIASAPGVTYPAYIDPPWSGGVLHRTFVDSAYPGTSYYNGAGASDAYQHVGYINAGNSDDGNSHITRSLWDLDLHGVVHTHIASANFDVNEVYSSSCNQTPVEAWVTGATSASTTWNNQPSWGGSRGAINAAYGYSASCPGPHDLGWDVSADVQNDADAGLTGINIGLKASDESNWLSWKKFDAAAVLRVIYYAIPGVASPTAITPCWAQCAEPTISRSLSPVVQASGFVDDAGQPGLRFGYKVCAGHTASPTSCKPVFYDSTTSDVHGFSNSAVAMPSALAASGAYEYQVQACRSDDPRICGGWSGWYQFSVDNVAPPAPTVTSTGFDLTGATRIGQEFVPGTIAVGPNGSVDNYAYSYSPTAGSVAISSPTCPATSTDVWVKCAAAGGATVSFTATPTLPSSNSVAVYAYDKAGNTSLAALFHYDVTATSAGQPSHAWFDTSAAANSGSPSVADWPGAPIAASLSSVDGMNVQWLTSAASPPPPYTGYAALSFGGHGAVSSTSSTPPVATLDAAHSFTVAAWVHPTASGAGTFTAVSQDSYNSAFYLQQSNSNWRMCMPQSITGTLVTDCATYTGASVDTTSWTLLVGEWDAPHRRITLYVGDASHFVSASHALVAAASTAPVVLGRAQSGGVQTGWWQGGIADPLVYPDLLDANQIRTLTGDSFADCVTTGVCA